MNSKSDSFEDLRTIKKIMEDSSRFLSLSGLSGLFAGMAALIGGAAAYFLILKNKTFLPDEFLMNPAIKESGSVRTMLIIDAIAVLLFAIVSSLYFSLRRAHRLKIRIWTPISKRLLINLSVPLVTGGILIIILYLEDYWQLIVPSMLIFYGLALVNAAKFTYNEVFALGLIEIIIGLTSAVFPEYGILFWCLGFGFLHLGYGFFMYRKYEG